MGQIIRDIFKYSVGFLVACLFLGWDAIPLMLLLGTALAINDHYQKKRENDPKYIAKKKEELKREAEESEREREAFYQRCLDNLKKYSD